MARILIFQETAGSLQALRKSLGGHHELIFAKDMPEALRILESTPIDLIISRVHLECSSVFEFIKTVKGDAKLSGIPFVCFCGKRNKVAKSLNPALASAAKSMGVDKYVILDHFCVEENCDFDRLRKEIEDSLSRAPGA